MRRAQRLTLAARHSIPVGVRPGVVGKFRPGPAGAWACPVPSPSKSATVGWAAEEALLECSASFHLRSLAGDQRGVRPSAHPR